MKLIVSLLVRRMKSNQASTPVLTAGEWLRAAYQSLPESLAKENGALSLQVLLAYVLKKSRTWILTHPETSIAPFLPDPLSSLLHRLIDGEPLPYLIGSQEFFGLNFHVTSDVLIPRPETEQLVEKGLEWQRAHPGRNLVVDVGTGSGCIAISLAKNLPEITCLAVDRSRRALQVVRQNAEKHGVLNRLQLLECDLLTACSGPFHLVCANLPYIPTTALNDLPVAKYEPTLALDGGRDGLSSIQSLLSDAPRWLAPDGLILLEMQYDQTEAITQIARTFLPGARIKVFSDLTNLPRIVEIHNPPES